MALSPRLFVILDLDSTLIFARVAELKDFPTDDERNFWVEPIGFEFYRVTVRKHLNTFLNQLEERGYAVIGWSASGASYVKDIFSVLFKGRKLEFLFTQDHLGVDGIKDLRQITKFIPDYLPENSRLVDDNPHHQTGQEKSFLLIKPFEFDGRMPSKEEDDDVLLTMADQIDRSFGLATDRTKNATLDEEL